AAAHKALGAIGRDHHLSMDGAPARLNFYVIVMGHNILHRLALAYSDAPPLHLFHQPMVKLIAASDAEDRITEEGVVVILVNKAHLADTEVLWLEGQAQAGQYIAPQMSDATAAQLLTGMHSLINEQHPPRPGRVQLQQVQRRGGPGRAGANDQNVYMFYFLGHAKSAL